MDGRKEKAFLMFLGGAGTGSWIACPASSTLGGSCKEVEALWFLFKRGIDGISGMDGRHFPPLPELEAPAPMPCDQLVNRSINLVNQARPGWTPFEPSL